VGIEPRPIARKSHAFGDWWTLYRSQSFNDLRQTGQQGVRRFPDVLLFFFGSYRLQVAQLWQRNRAKLQTFSINVQCYSQNYAQNCIFGPPYVRIGCNVCGLFDSFNTKKLCNRDSSRECQFYSWNSELAFLSHQFFWRGRMRFIVSWLESL